MERMAAAAAGTASLWWDREKCPLPSSFDPYIVISMVPALLHRFNIIDANAGGGGCSFSAYQFLSRTQTEPDRMLVNSGIRLHQLPPGGTIYETEKMLMADVLLWAMDTPPPANIIFIVGNVDFSDVFEKLRHRAYNIFLVCPSVSEMPQGMLNAANDCLGLLSFLRSLENEDHPLQKEVNFPLELSKQKNPVCAVNRNSSPEFEPIVETDPKLKQKASADDFREFINQMLLAGKLSQGFLMGCLRPEFEEQTGKVLDVKRLGYKKLSKLVASYSHLVSVDNTGTGFSRIFPAGFGSEALPSKPSAATSTRKKKPVSLEQFKAWLGQVVNQKKHRKGYNISSIRLDFKKATGKTLDAESLGFSKIIKLVQECKDVAQLKEVKQGCHLAFPVKSKKQNSLVTSLGAANPNPKFTPNPILKLKASVDEFSEFIYQMLLAGEFSEGFPMSRLPEKFEQHTGKFLDVKHLGYKKLTALVYQYSLLVSVENAATEFSRIFPAPVIREIMANPNSDKDKATSINTDGDPTKMKAKVEADRPSSDGNGKELLESRASDENIYIERLPFMNSERKWLPSMTTGSRASASLSHRESNAHAFQEYNSIKLNSSSTPGRTVVSEGEGQSSNTTSDSTTFHGELKGSDFIKQHVSTLQCVSNDPVEDSVNSENLKAEAIQNMRLMKETANFCGKPSIHGRRLALPDFIPAPSKSPSSEPQAGYSSRSAENLRHGIRLDSKQNYQNRKSVGNEENTTSTVSSAGSIIQFAGRGIKSIHKLIKWRKNP